MDWEQIVPLLEQARAEGWSWSTFLAQVASTGVATTPGAQVDLDRHGRCGYPEVVFAQGKSPEQVVQIVGKLLEHSGTALVTRVDEQTGQLLREHFPQGELHPLGRTFRLGCCRPGAPRGHVAVVAAGTSDLPVAHEAEQTAVWMGAQVDLVADVGVAGPHRLWTCLPQLQQAQALVVTAGMEGALPSVVAGYVSVPVVAVPTSVGYGAALGGVAALLAMLNSCAANVAVVNIDAGFKAGYLAAMIAQAGAATGSAPGKDRPHSPQPEGPAR